MDHSFWILLRELPPSTTAFILLAGVFYTLARKGCFPSLSQRQFFYLIMTFTMITGYKILFG